MYILDSDVLTIVNGGRRSTNVMTWYGSVDETDVYLSVIAIFEKSRNAATLTKKGDPRFAALAEWTLATLKRIFADRILAIDAAAAEDWGRMLGAKDKHTFDTAIAAIAKQYNFTVVTRNVSDYVERGVTVLDPFKNPPKITNP